ncbi:alpha-mannosidase 1 [Crepidotus variabilis]|uniref:alpha-1,2-Mannosidase n=1 Tax=Crepidotus variabilis TaxID=179855 RepID=A0A9P6EFZ1_9AGAR|nr:alpha-mannosidase 1 [Crepidotus variabilis]
MRATHTLLSALAATLSLSPLVQAVGQVQQTGLVVPSDQLKHKDEVKKMFTDSYGAYKQYAYPHDNLSPIGKKFSDGRNGWGATIVDAMDTMFIMGLTDLFYEATNFSSAIDFSHSKTADTVSVFETTIRYVGGLLSAYELSGEQIPDLLTKARQVADKLSYAWVGTNSIPYSHIDFSNNKPVVATSNIAEAGTLTLEFAILSKYTGNDKYRLLAEKSARFIAQNGAPLPGLPAQGIDPTTQSAVGGYITWGGGSDSYFEYLIKYPWLNIASDPIYADSWRAAVDSSIRTLLRTSTLGDYTYLADYDDQGKIRHVSSHLACFHGGNWILGGRLLENQTIVDYGLKLTDTCWNTYTSSATGIGPEAFAFVSSDGSYTGGNDPTTSEKAYNNQHGFYPTSSAYIQRPEVLESNFYAWRATGDTKYLNRAAAAVASLNEYTQVSSGGYAGLADVNNLSGSMYDNTESFWYAETLKYLYLTFDDPSRFSLDEYVFNTEAHPFKVTPAPKDKPLGSGTPYTPLTPFKTITGDLPAISAIPEIPGFISGVDRVLSGVLNLFVLGI